MNQWNDMRRPARVLAWIIVFATCFMILGMNSIRPVAYLSWMWAEIATISIVMLLALAWFREYCSQRLATLFFLGQVVAVLFGVWNNQQNFARSGEPFEAFTGYRLIALSIALIAPPKTWVGVLAISLAGIVMLIQYILWVSAESPVPLAIQEPWLTLIYIFVAGPLYMYRLYASKVASELVRVTTEAESLRRFANLMVQARHLANTPLQTIATTTDVLRAQNPVLSQQLERIQRSVNRVQRVTHLFAPYEPHLSLHDAGQVIDYNTIERDILAELARASPATAESGSHTFKDWNV